jgi:hypothetical protein
MNRRPYLLALLLALTTLTGFVGMMVVTSYWDGLFFVIAAAPLALGALACWLKWGRVCS